MRLTRIYPNGEKRTLDSGSVMFSMNYHDIEDWQQYNKTFRFGCALFIDGECVYKGVGHKQEDLDRHAAEEKLSISPESCPSKR